MELSECEKSAKKLKELIDSDVVKQLKGANEATTRLLIIDEVLSILGWSKEEFNPEKVTSVTNYTDYLLTIDGEKRLVVEAKKIDKISPFPTSIRHTNYTNRYLVRHCGEDLKELIYQAKEYCSEQGVFYAIATTGEVWIILTIAIKSQIGWGDQKSFVFHTLEDVAANFNEFYGLLSRNAVKDNSLEKNLQTYPQSNPK